MPQKKPRITKFKCSSCDDPIFGNDSITLCLECTDSIQALLNGNKPKLKCSTGGLPYLERDIQALAIAARKAKRLIHKSACGKNICCDECLLLGETLERFFYNIITEI